MIHKIHMARARERLHDLGNNSRSTTLTVTFTKDIDNCTVCHRAARLATGAWSRRRACGACHDDVNFATGANHGAARQRHRTARRHPATAPTRRVAAADRVAHCGAARIAEGASTRAAPIASIDSATQPVEPSGTIDYSVTRDGTPMTLQSTRSGRRLGGAAGCGHPGWNISDFTNAGHTSTPAQPISINALNVGGVVQALGGGVYRTVATLPSSATSGSVSIGLEGHPAADLDGDGTYSDRIAVRNDVMFLDATTGRPVGIVERRQVIDVTRCDTCHDAAGNGLSLHGNNRTGEDLCSICHNPTRRQPSAARRRATVDGS
jgi:OmcA/MtrC family decaheme c-type cytochrome